MGLDLFAKQVLATYDSLLKVGDNDTLTGTPKRISDGRGNDSPIWLGTTRIGIGLSPESGVDLQTNIGKFGSVITTSLRIDGSLTDSLGEVGTENQVLISTGSATKWASISAVSGVSGTGTTNTIPLWTSGTSIGNSILTQSGSTIDVNGKLYADTIQLSGGTGDQGTLSWNVDEETLDLIQNGATLQLGQEIQIHCKNQTGTIIPDGTPVYVTGTLGASGRLTIAPMIADGSIPAKYFIGVTTEAIADGDDGKVTTFGKIRGLNTAAYSEGQTLWVSATTAGAFVTTRPVAPNLDLEVAIVINSSVNNGTIFVRSSIGHYLGTAHDVNISSVAENDLLVYKTNRWVNSKSIGDLSAANVTLSGYLRGPATFVIDPAAYGDETGLVQILGDLRVDGTTTTINSTTISVSDKNITLAKDAATAGDANGAGITIAGASATLTYLSASDDFTFNKNVNASRFVGPLTGDVTGTVSDLSNHDTDDLAEGLTNLYFTTARARAAFSAGTGVSIASGVISIGQSVGTTDDVTFGTVTASLSGNADTASALATARNIALDGSVTGNADFDGSGNITITTTTNHNHDDRYYTETESDAKYLLNTTDTLDGNLTVTGDLIVTGGIDLSNADLDIGSADIIFGTTAGGATRGLIWDVSGSGFLSKLIGGGADGGKVTLFANMDDAITTGNIFEIKDGSTGSLFLSLSHAGILTAGGGTSTQWNTAYSWGDHAGLYSLLGHTHDDRYYTETESDNRFVNVAGDTMTGNLYVGSGSDVLRAFRVGGENAAGGRVFIEYNGDSSYIDCYGGHGGTQRYRDLLIGSRKLTVFSTDTMAGGWNKTLELKGDFPVAIFNSANSKYAGIGYDYSLDTQGLLFWTNATTNDVNGTGTVKFRIQNDGNVNIGSGTSGYKLRVEGNAYFTNELYVNDVWSSGYGPRINGGDILFKNWTGTTLGKIVTTNGYFAIGNVTPTANLHILSAGDATSLRLDYTNSNETQFGFDSGGQYIETKGADAGRRKLRMQVFNGTSNYTQLFLDAANNYIYTNTDASFGIGTQTPSTKLHVGGVITATGGTSTNWNSAYTYSNVGHLPLAGGTLTGNLSIGNDANRYIRYNTATNWRYDLYAINDDFFIRDANSTNFFKAIYNGGGSNKYSAILDKLYVFNNGSVGINETSILGTFTSKTSGVGSTTDYAVKNIIASAPLVTGYTGSKIVSLFSGYDSTIHAVDYGYSYDGTGYKLHLSTNPITSGNPVTAMTISRSQKVGIGNLNPDYKLDVTSAAGAGLRVITSGAAFNSPSISLLDNSNANEGILAMSSFGMEIGTYSNSNVIFKVNQSTKATLTTNGNLLLNITSDLGYKLDVNGTGRFTDSLTADVFNSSRTSLYLLRDATVSGYGIYKNTTTEIGIAVNGSVALNFTSSGAATFSSSVTANGTMSLENDGTYGSTYKTLGFTGNSNGSHRIFSGTADDMYFAAATARGFQFRPNGSTTTTFTISPTGAATFSGQIIANAANGAISVNGSGYTLNPSSMLIGLYTSSRGYIQVPDSGQIEIWTAGTSEIATFKNNKEAIFYGNVGISNTSPATKLEVSGGDAMSGGWNKNTTLSATYPVLIFNSNNSKWAGIGYDYSAAMRIWVNGSSNDVNGTGTQAVAINNNGNVGILNGGLAIGKETPYATLDVNGNASISGSNYLYFGAGATLGSWATRMYSNGSQHRFNANGFAFTNEGYGSSEWITIKSTGYVGVNSTNPQERFSVYGGHGSTNGNIAIKVEGPSYYPCLEFGVENSYDGLIRTYGNDLKIYAGHWRTKGTASSENHSIFFYTSKSGSADWSTPKMTLNQDGALSVLSSITAGGDVYAYSDARVKENVETIDNALNKVMSMRGVSYNRTDNDDKTKKVGVIAQEIQKVLPEVVTEQADGMLSVSYGNIVGVLIEAIKEQQKQIDELKAIINGSTK